MMIERVSYEWSDSLKGDVSTAVKHLQRIKDLIRISVKLVSVGSGDVLQVKILESMIELYFNDNGTFVYAMLKHDKSENLIKSMNSALDLVDKHIDLFNDYMKLLGENL